MPNKMKINKDLIISDTSKTLGDLTKYETNFQITEQKIGKWGNKDLYCKVIPFGAVGFSSTTTVPCGIVNIYDELLGFTGALVRSYGDIVYSLENMYMEEVSYRPGDDAFALKTNNQYVGFKSGYIILFYTKK